jgi:hypothetical protein
METDHEVWAWLPSAPMKVVWLPGQRDPFERVDRYSQRYMRRPVIRQHSLVERCVSFAAHICPPLCNDSASYKLVPGKSGA